MSKANRLKRKGSPKGSEGKGSGVKWDTDSGTERNGRERNGRKGGKGVKGWKGTCSDTRMGGPNPFTTDGPPCRSGGSPLLLFGGQGESRYLGLDITPELPNQGPIFRGE